MFSGAKKAVLPLGIGVLTHFILDFFLVHMYSGMKLLFPFSWDEWHVYVYRLDDYGVTILAILVALFVYGTYWLVARRKKPRINA